MCVVVVGLVVGGFVAQLQLVLRLIRFRSFFKRFGLELLLSLGDVGLLVCPNKNVGGIPIFAQHLHFLSFKILVVFAIAAIEVVIAVMLELEVRSSLFAHRLLGSIDGFFIVVGLGFRLVVLALGEAKAEMVASKISDDLFVYWLCHCWLVAEVLSILGAVVDVVEAQVYVVLAGSGLGLLSYVGGLGVGVVVGGGEVGVVVSEGKVALPKIWLHNFWFSAILRPVDLLVAGGEVGKTVSKVDMSLSALAINFDFLLGLLDKLSMVVGLLLVMVEPQDDIVDIVGLVGLLLLQDRVFGVALFELTLIFGVVFGHVDVSLSSGVGHF